MRIVVAVAPPPLLFIIEVVMRWIFPQDPLCRCDRQTHDRSKNPAAKQATSSAGELRQLFAAKSASHVDSQLMM